MPYALLLDSARRSAVIGAGQPAEQVGELRHFVPVEVAEKREADPLDVRAAGLAQALQAGLRELRI
jgi:hypothetical protein